MGDLRTRHRVLELHHRLEAGQLAAVIGLDRGTQLVAQPDPPRPSLSPFRRCIMLGKSLSHHETDANPADARTWEHLLHVEVVSRCWPYSESGA